MPFQMGVNSVIAKLVWTAMRKKLYLQPKTTTQPYSKGEGKAVP